MAYINSLKTPEWTNKRNEIYKRDNYKCVICGANKNLSVHHLYYLPETMPWEYDNEGLITVCNDHHKMLNYELPKLSGIIAFKILNCEIDLKDIMK
jgi:5-methylcytosine-specific restriction endonuclease McrA